MKKIDNIRLQYLVSEYQASRENRHYEELNEMLKPYAMGLVGKFNGNRVEVQWDDEHESIIHNALFDALKKYDAERKANFKTFFYYILKEHYYNRILENARTLSAPSKVKKVKLRELSTDMYEPSEEIISMATQETDQYLDDEYAADFMLFLEEGQREALEIFMTKPFIRSREKKMAKVYVNRERIRILYQYYNNLQSNDSERAVYLIGIKRVIVDNTSILKVTKEINDALDDCDYMKKEMSAALLYVFHHLQKRYPVLKNPALENRLKVFPQEEDFINPIKLEIVTNIIRKEVEKCLTH